MQIIPTNHPRSIKEALKALAKGELVIYPTETCYGLAVDATNPEAVSKLLHYKGDRHRQVSVAVSSSAMARQYVNLNSMAKNLYREFLPGPITVISNSLHRLDPRLESERGTLGVRYPAHPFALKLIKAFGKPLTATSANTSGKKEPYSLADWKKYSSAGKQKLVSLFLNAGKLADRPTSTVVDTTLNSPEVLRQGILTLPHRDNHFTTTSPKATQQLASRLLSRYLPLTRHSPLILALSGELGVGKTQFVKGLAQALGIKELVTSPTYLLMREYPYSLPKYVGTLYHLDTWRLSNMNELDTTLHLPSLFKPGNILAVEWAGKAKSWLKKYEKNYPNLLINIEELSESTRLINYAFTIPKWS